MIQAQMRNRFQGKTVAITGGAGDIGSVIALAFVCEGANVSIGDIDIKRAKKVANDACSVGPGSAEASSLDVTDIDSIHGWIDATVKKYGGLDILVNTAAVMPVKPSLEVTAEDWDRTHAINLRGTFFCAQSAIAQMKRQGRGGRIVSIAAIDAKCGVPAVAFYSSTKAGIVNLSQALAVEFAKDAITVNCVCPGWVKTDGVLNNTSWNWREGIKKIPMGRMAEPREVADLILYLASDSAGAITGESVNIDCGEWAGI
ncbi:MAG: SDR family oxidoreductase [Chloroflexi bacterium]|nr:SDR family oxidoreductase [Chloroflexota bacterium]